MAVWQRHPVLEPRAVTAPNRAPGSSWSLRHPDVRPNGTVSTLDDDRIIVWYDDGSTKFAQRMILSRRDARLLAKRINQCLDRTRRP